MELMRMQDIEDAIVKIAVEAIRRRASPTQAFFEHVWPPGFMDDVLRLAKANVDREFYVVRQSKTEGGVTVARKSPPIGAGARAARDKGAVPPPVPGVVGATDGAMPSPSGLRARNAREVREWAEHSCVCVAWLSCLITTRAHPTHPSHTRTHTRTHTCSLPHHRRLRPRAATALRGPRRRLWRSTSRWTLSTSVRPSAPHWRRWRRLWRRTCLRVRLRLPRPPLHRRLRQLRRRTCLRVRLRLPRPALHERLRQRQWPMGPQCALPGPPRPTLCGRSRQNLQPQVNWIGLCSRATSLSVRSSDAVHCTTCRTSMAHDALRVRTDAESESPTPWPDAVARRAKPWHAVARRAGPLARPGGRIFVTDAQRLHWCL